MMTLSKLGAAYQKNLADRGCKASTITQARTHLKQLVAFFGEDCDVSKLDVDALGEFTAHRLTEVKEASVNGSLRVLRSMLIYGKKTKKVADYEPIKLVREARKLPTVLAPEEVYKLMKAATPITRTALVLAVDAGLRHAEIVHLEPGDLDFRRGVIRVKAKADWEPKSWEERDVPMSRRVREELSKRIKGANGRVFKDPELYDNVRSAFRKAGLYVTENKPGLHMLRRTWATDLLGVGADIETVRILGGWKDLATVQRYITSTDARKHAAIEALGR